MEKDTKYSDLESTLKAVGKSVFVKFYYDFKDTSISTDELAEKIYRENPRAKSVQQRFRIPRARHIFFEKKQIEALEIIISSLRVDNEYRKLAKDILLQEQQVSMLENEKAEENTILKDVNRTITYGDEGIIESYDNSPKSPKSSVCSMREIYPRDKQVAVNALRMAQYLCEVDPNHHVFRRKNANTTYTEPHHLVPLSAQRDFPNISLDREQNVVSLCSNCHNHLHYGADIDEILRPLFETRKELLKEIGIVITFEQLKKYY